jgi:hypothetical protein
MKVVFATMAMAILAAAVAAGVKATQSDGPGTVHEDDGSATGNTYHFDTNGDKMFIHAGTAILLLMWNPATERYENSDVAIDLTAAVNEDYVYDLEWTDDEGSINGHLKKNVI